MQLFIYLYKSKGFFFFTKNRVRHFMCLLKPTRCFNFSSLGFVKIILLGFVLKNIIIVDRYLSDHLIVHFFFGKNCLSINCHNTNKNIQHL